MIKIHVRIEGGWLKNPGPNVNFKRGFGVAPDEKKGLKSENIGAITFNSGLDALRMMKDYYPDFRSDHCWFSVTTRHGSLSIITPRDVQDALDCVRKELDRERKDDVFGGPV